MDNAISFAQSRTSVLRPESSDVFLYTTRCGILDTLPSRPESQLFPPSGKARARFYRCDLIANRHKTKNLPSDTRVGTIFENVDTTFGKHASIGQVEYVSQSNLLCANQDQSEGSRYWNRRC